MLTSSSRIRWDVPGEPDTWMVFRRLNALQLEAAERARSRAVIREHVSLGADVLEAIQAWSTPNNAEALRQAVRNPLNTYDRSTVLRAGIVEWSYGDPVQPEQVDDLDKVTSDAAFALILRHSGVMGVEGAPDDEGKAFSPAFTGISLEAVTVHQDGS